MQILIDITILVITCVAGDMHHRYLSWWPMPAAPPESSRTWSWATEAVNASLLQSSPWPWCLARQWLRPQIKGSMTLAGTLSKGSNPSKQLSIQRMESLAGGTLMTTNTVPFTTCWSEPLRTPGRSSPPIWTFSNGRNLPSMRTSWSQPDGWSMQLRRGRGNRSRSFCKWLPRSRRSFFSTMWPTMYRRPGNANHQRSPKCGPVWRNGMTLSATRLWCAQWRRKCRPTLMSAMPAKSTATKCSMSWTLVSWPGSDWIKGKVNPRIAGWFFWGWYPARISWL